MLDSLNLKNKQKRLKQSFLFWMQKKCKEVVLILRKKSYNKGFWKN